MTGRKVGMFDNQHPKNSFIETVNQSEILQVDAIIMMMIRNGDE